ncbi:MAG: O-antigen ligase family protein [Planctomycetota bacterium]
MEDTASVAPWLNGLALGLVLALLFVAPIPIGGEALWAQGALFIGVSAAVALWLAGAAVRGSLPVARTPALGFAVLFFLLALLQVTPLPADLVGQLSPAAQATRLDAFGPAAAPETTTLSLHPYATKTALFRYGACFLIFLLVASLVRSKRAVAWVAGMLLAAALFQVIYAMGESVSGGDHIFWVEKVYYRDKFTGTFLNKNHFAGFLEMVLPLAVGLVVAVEATSRPFRPRDTVQRVVLGLQSGDVQKRIALGVPVVLLAVGVAASLSRSAVIASLAGLSGLAIAALISGAKGPRRIVGALLIAVLGAGAIFVSGPVLSHFEAGFTGRMASMRVRLDMLQSSFALMRDFPLVGTGLNTLRHVFGPYQSMNLGNVHVDYLANDWAQIICETGFLGFAIVTLGFLVFLALTVVAAWRRHDRFCRWVALGCVAGAVVMLLHSFSDFNLSRITSNAMLFAAILGLAHAAAHAERTSSARVRFSGQGRLPLGPLPVRVLIALTVAGALIALGVRQGRVAAAHVHYNHYLRYSRQHVYDPLVEPSPPFRGLYYFLPLPPLPARPERAARRELERARRLDPLNPHYANELGDVRIGMLQDMALEEARRLVRERIPGSADLSPESLEFLASHVLSKDAILELVDDNSAWGLLLKAQDEFRSAARQAPTVPRYHLNLARCLRLRARLEARKDPGRAAALRRAFEDELGRALQFGRNVPYILFQAGHLVLRDAVEPGGVDRAAGIDRASELFRRAIYAAPRVHAERVFEMLRQAGVPAEKLFDATPDTVAAHRCLCRFLLTRGEKDWPLVLKVLDKLEELVAASREDAVPERPPWPDEGTEEPAPAAAAEPDGDEGLPPRFAWASEWAPTLELQLDILRKRISVLGLLGRWEERTRALTRHADMSERHAEETLREAARQYEEGQFEQAMRTYRDALILAPASARGLIGMARATSIPSAREAAPATFEPFACLFRLIVTRDELEPETYQELLAVLDELQPNTDRERLLHEFVTCTAAIIRTGDRTTDGLSRPNAVQRLYALDTSGDPTVEDWPQRHLLSYYQGVGFERDGDAEAAIEAYRKVLMLVENHLPSLDRLCELCRTEPDVARFRARRAALLPEQAAVVTFAGRIRLLGYSAEPASRDEPTGTIRYHWLTLAPPPAGYRARTYFFEPVHWETRTADRNRVVSPVWRCGEVVVEKRRLPPEDVRAETPYAAVFLYTAHPPEGWPRRLRRDGRLGLARLRLVVE